MSSSAERTPVGTVLRSGDGTADHAAVPFTLERPQAEPAPRSSRAAAHAEGYSTGWGQGIREARAATSAARERAVAEFDLLLAERTNGVGRAVSAMHAAAEQVRATTVQRAEEVLDATVAAAVELAEAMAGAALAADLVTAARLSIRRSLDELPATVPVTVRVHPADHAELVADVAGLAPGMTVTLVADPAVEPGGAVAETDVTTVDATLSAAVRRVRSELAR